jgi:predicted kinase
MIEVLVGMIASGKSTWANMRAKDGWVVLNDDAIVSAVHGGDYTLYSKDLKLLYKSIEDHILHTAVAMGKNVVVDRGLDIRETSRRRWIAIAKSLDVPINAIVFKKEAPEIHAERRASSDSRGHDYTYWLEEVAKVHDKQWVQPTSTEGFDEIIMQMPL